MEIFTYQSNVEISGLPYTRSEKLVDKFKIICDYVNFKFNIDDVKYVHRTQSKSQPKLIVVEFKNKFIKEDVLLTLETKRVSLDTLLFDTSTEVNKMYVHDHLSA